jgi:hypothetical protein
MNDRGQQGRDRNGAGRANIIKQRRRSLLRQEVCEDDEDIFSSRDLGESMSGTSEGTHSLDGNESIFTDQLVERFCLQNNVFHILQHHLDTLGDRLPSRTGKSRQQWESNAMFLLDVWFIRCWDDSHIVKPDEDIDVFISDLCHLLLTSSEHIKVLHMERISLGEEFFRRASFFAFHGLKSAACTLTALHLPFCEISSVTLAVILGALSSSVSNRFLSTLDLSYNRLTGHSLPVLCMFLRELRLVSLNLRGNSLGASGADPMHFEELIQECSMMNFLDVSFTKLKHEESHLVVRSLHHLTQATELCLEGLNLSPSLAVALANIVEGLPRLRILRIAFNASCSSVSFSKRIQTILSNKTQEAADTTDAGASDALKLSPSQVVANQLADALGDPNFGLSPGYTRYTSNEPSLRRNRKVL